MTQKSTIHKKTIAELKTEDNKYNSSFLLGSVSFCAYTACYAGRSILSAIMPEMLKNDIYNKTDFGYMGSAFFFAYGIGQIINGILGDKINSKYMVSIGLLMASASSLLFTFVDKAYFGIILWALCGLALSMLWGPLTKVIAENTNAKTGRMLLTALSAASILGTMAAYLAATAASAYGLWKSAFYMTAIILFIASVLWYICLGYLEKKNALNTIKENNQNVKNNKELHRILVDNAIFPMIAVAMVNGIIRNAVAFWIPTYILEKLEALPTMASGITSFLPLVNLAGMFTGVYLLGKLKENEHLVSIIMFAASTTMFLILWLINGRLFVISIICLFMAGAAMASVCNLIFSSYCLQFRTTGRVSTVTGFLNFISYASSAIASAVFVYLVKITDWNFIVFIWTSMTFVGGIFAMLAFNKKNYIFK